MPSGRPGQLLFAGFEGTEVPADLARLLSQGRVGGVILFARNFVDAAQVRSLTASLHDCAPPDEAVLIAIDQEGGRVARLRDPWTEWPPMRRLGDLDDLDVTADVARALARELLDLGIGLDFVPCVDVDTNPENPIIGDRSFGRDAATVARHARRFVEALQGAGVAGCAKHFPGHGDTSTDSHLELPRLDHDLERLRAVELPPFAAAIDAGVATVMTAHVLFPALDPERPATLSPEVMGLLRTELAYEGVVFSDDIEMKAVAERYTPGQIVDGCFDSLLVCRDADLRDAVLALLEAMPESRLGAALARMAALKQRFAERARDAASDERAPYHEHRALAARFG